MACAVFAEHALKDRVGAGLERQMAMAGDTRLGGDEFEQVARPVHWLDGADAEAPDGGFGQKQPKHVQKAQLRREIAAPAAEIDAAEHNFGIAGAQIADLDQNAFDCGATGTAADARDDAKGAAVAATVLDFEVGAGAVAADATDGRGGELAEPGNIVDQDLTVIILRAFLPNELRDFAFAAVAHHPADAWQCGQFVWCALRVTAGNQNFRCWMVAMESANDPPGIDIGAVGDGTGIEHNQVGFSGSAHGDQSHVFKRGFDGCAVRLRGAAPVTLDKYFFHESFEGVITTLAGSTPGSRHRNGWFYSVRNACCGAIPNARRTGTIDARIIVPSMHTAHPANAHGSRGATPNSCDRSSVTAASAPGTPMSVPSATIPAASDTNNPAISFAEAPSAIRMPISRVRRVSV